MRSVLSLSLLLLLLALPAAAQECADSPTDGASRLSAELRNARSYRAGETVPRSVQKATLNEILRRMRERKIERETDPTLPKFCVMLDLDNTSFVPTKRAHAGLKRVSTKYGIPELATPSALTLLPHYSKPGFLAWADETGLRAKYPALDWNAVYATHNGASWNPSLDKSETLVPGLLAFSRKVSRDGGVLVFNTARKEAQRAATVETLKKNGMTAIKLVMKQGSVASPKSKVDRVAEIREKWCEPIAFVDETAVNHDAMAAAFPDMMQVTISIPGFTTELTKAELDAEEYRISTYQR